MALLIGFSCAATYAQDIAIHSETYQGHPDEKSPDYYSERDEEEIEGAWIVTFEEPAAGDPPGALRLYMHLEDNDWDDWDSLDACQPCEALSSASPIEEMMWDEAGHQIRQRLSPLWLSIEAGRYEVEDDDDAPDAEKGLRALNLGTDVFDDWYLDSDEFVLTENDFSLRARKRWDSVNRDDDVEIRRLLIQIKTGSKIDSFGLKRAPKFDIRNRTPSKAAIPSLVEDAMRGFVTWPLVEDGDPTPPIPARPVRRVYESLAKAGKLSQSPSGDQDVLRLKPQAFLRSVRSRYHLRETPLTVIETQFFQRGFGLASEVANLGEARIENGGLTRGDRKAMGRLVRTAERLYRSQGKLNSMTRPAFEDVKALQRVNTVSASLDEDFSYLARMIRSEKRALTGGDDSSVEAIQFREWIRREGWRREDRIGNQRTMRYALEVYRSGDHTDLLSRFNEYGKNRRDDDSPPPLFETFRPLDADAFLQLGRDIEAVHILELARQLEAAGSAARGIWLNFALTVFVGEASRPVSDLVIDTLDITGYYTAQAWSNVPAKEQTTKVMPEREALFDATLINEVQLELRRMTAFTKRIDELTKRRTAGENVDALLNGTETVFKIYHDALSEIVSLRKVELADKLRDLGFPSQGLEPAAESKGQRALNAVRNRS